ncbi:MULTISPECIES: IS110 family transposase [Streptomyces]|uniref:IS110 family transposase n=1 Tax=Streptomyces TaxID=1883 RepID=UPI001F3287A9|nr:MULTISPECIES: IS110 family transposase [Streptomyces]
MAAGDNPERLRSEASFAVLCGVSPVEASSGKTQRRCLHHRAGPSPMGHPHPRLHRQARLGRQDPP